MSDAPLLTPQEHAAAMHPDAAYALSAVGGIVRHAARVSVEADRVSLAEWCEEQARDARAMSRNCVSGGDGVAAREYDGAARAFDDVVARLRGTI